MGLCMSLWLLFLQIIGVCVGDRERELRMSGTCSSIRSRGAPGKGMNRLATVPRLMCGLQIGE